MKYFKFDDVSREIMSKDPKGTSFFLNRRSFIVTGSALFAGFSCPGIVPYALAGKRNANSQKNIMMILVA